MLANELVGGDVAPLVLVRHIDIVEHEDEIAAIDGIQYVLARVHQLLLHVLLRFLGRGSQRARIEIQMRQFIHIVLRSQIIPQESRLACARRPYQENGMLRVDQTLHQEVDPTEILRLHDHRKRVLVHIF